MPFPGSPLPFDKVYAMARSVAPRARARFPASTDTVLARVVTAAAKQESQFHPLAFNGYSGDDEAIGLMQILPPTQKEIERWLKLPHDRQRLYEPEYALLLGATYMAYQRKRYKEWPRAIYSYFAGSYPGKPKDRAKARTYLRLILGYYKKFFGSDPATDERRGVIDPSVRPDENSGSSVVVAGIAITAVVLLGGWTLSKLR